MIVVMKTTYSLPKRKYCSGEKKMVSWRLPEALFKKLESIAEAGGWTVTDVVMTALDDFIQDREISAKHK
jgi:NRPS condensation-like uncharacterized protein